MVHPGIPDESRGVEFGNRELERYLLDADRSRELEACINARRLIDRASLSSYTQLAREAEATPA